MYDKDSDTYVNPPVASAPYTDLVTMTKSIYKTVQLCGEMKASMDDAAKACLNLPSVLDYLKGTPQNQSKADTAARKWIVRNQIASAFKAYIDTNY